ncbi:MAG TPA: 3-hydroxybenzoate 4-monooxygenase, partial [Terrimesophilobacter sp.]|nr:3-hydroxybenzoate 4-monooxygenase [Terrimesophilobacter sp.]
NPVHLGHHHRADGRWRVYAFADGTTAGEASVLADWAEWMADGDSPVARFTPVSADRDRVFDVKVIYQQTYEQVDLGRVPDIFLPRVGDYGLIDYEKVYAADPRRGDIFEERDIDRAGCVVIVRPDQYVAHILPLTARDELTAFFARSMLAGPAAQAGAGLSSR